jgi:hypothetical protein
MRYKDASLKDETFVVYIDATTASPTLVSTDL